MADVYPFRRHRLRIGLLSLGLTLIVGAAVLTLASIAGPALASMALSPAILAHASPTFLTLTSFTAFFALLIAIGTLVAFLIAVNRKHRVAMSSWRMIYNSMVAGDTGAMTNGQQLPAQKPGC